MKKFVISLTILLFCFIMIRADNKSENQVDTVKTLSPEELKFEESKNYSTGWEYWKNKMFLEAIQPLKKVLTLNPKRLNGWKHLSDCYQNLMTQYKKEGDSEKAALYLDSALTTYYGGLEQFPDYPYFYQMLGYIYMQYRMIAEFCILVN